MRGQAQVSKGSSYDLSSDGLSSMQTPGETYLLSLRAFTLSATPPQFQGKKAKTYFRWRRKELNGKQNKLGKANEC